MKNINTRRSIRKYSDKEVSEKLLNRLFAEASRTQTMGNMQPSCTKRPTMSILLRLSTNIMLRKRRFLRTKSSLR